MLFSYRRHHSPANIFEEISLVFVAFGSWRILNGRSVRYSLDVTSWEASYQ